MTPISSLDPLVEGDNGPPSYIPPINKHMLSKYRELQELHIHRGTLRLAPSPASLHHGVAASKALPVRADVLRRERII